METALPEIKIALMRIEIHLLHNLYLQQDSLDFWKGCLHFWQGSLNLQHGGCLDFWQVGKIIKVALSAVPKPTSTRDLKSRSMLCLRRTFPKKN